jgi:aerobic-type carbon monoxide dehydrogenase small subunit (CoxS/CutS family)
MTRAKRKKVITIETFQRTVIRQAPNKTQILWCEFCQAEVEMTAPELAATILGVKVREIYRRIEQGKLHFFEMETGEVFICQRSLI